MATLERDSKEVAAVRIYDTAMDVEGEYVFKQEIIDDECGPMLAPGGEQVVFVAQNRKVFVGQLVAGAGLQVNEVCSIPKSKLHFRPQGTLGWLNDYEFIVGGSVREYHHVNLGTRTSALLDGDASFLGVTHSGIAVSSADRGLTVVNTNGEVISKLGYSLADSHFYSGCYIHRVSPDGRYLAFEHPVTYGLLGQVLTIQDLKTNREVHLHLRSIPNYMGSWLEIPKEKGSEREFGRQGKTSHNRR